MAFYNPRELSPVEQYLFECFDVKQKEKWDASQPKGEHLPKEVQDAIWEIVQILFGRYCAHDKEVLKGILQQNAPAAFRIFNHARAIVHELAPVDYSNIRLG